MSMMNKRKTIRKWSPFALIISFNEFAWICFFVVALLYAMEKLENEKINKSVIEKTESFNQVTDLFNAEKLKNEKIYKSFSVNTESFNQVSNLFNEVARLTARNEEYNLRSVSNQSTLQMYDELNTKYELEKKDNAENSRLLTIANFKLGNLQSFVSNYITAESLAKSSQANIQKTNLDRSITSSERSPESMLRKELLGLKGDFRRVVFVMDISGSMAEHDKWNQVVKVMSDWLKYLPVEECALVIYSDRVAQYPEDGSFLKVTGPTGDQNRELLISMLNNVQPNGYTETLKALQAAFAYNGVDTIILFTDGAPEKPPPNNLPSKRKKNMQEIYSFCGDMVKNGRKVPINTVGLGDYFAEDLGAFLLKVSEITGGTFVGR